MTAATILSVVSALMFALNSAMMTSARVFGPALAGLLILLTGLERLTRLLFDGSKAVQRGHDWATIAFVVSDARHDAGFLLQGARQYSTLEERDRRMLLAARVVAGCGYAAALIWMP